MNGLYDGKWVYVLSTISCLALIVVLPVPAHGASDAGYLTFHKVLSDTETPDGTSNKNERSQAPGNSKDDQIQIERTPSLRVRLADVRSVIAERKSYAEDSKNEIESALKKSLGLEDKRDKEQNGTEMIHYYCEVTFDIEQDSAWHLEEFARKHDRERFDLRINELRLTLFTFIGPFESKEFTVFVDECDIRQIGNTLSPISDRLTWK